MPKYNVVVTRRIPDSGLELLKKAGFNVKISPLARALKKNELLSFVKGAHAILCLLTDNIGREVVKAAGPQLKAVANYAVGYNNIDVKGLKKLKIKVSNTPGVLTDTVADMTWALLMASARRITEADVFTRKGNYQGWAPMLLLGQDVHQKILGLVGFGRIGQAVAERAQGFSMKVIYYDAGGKKSAWEKKLKASYRPLKTVIQQADFLSLHVPLLPSTKYLIGANEFKLMKKSSILINTSRGPVVNEKALVLALKNKIIAGAGLDVFENEPKLTKGLNKLSNIVLSPHIASASIATRGKMAVMAARNIIMALNNKKMPNEIL